MQLTIVYNGWAYIIMTSRLPEREAATQNTTLDDVLFQGRL